MDTHEKIKLYRETFRGRQDIIPRFWVSKNGKKTGYSIVCANEWNKQLCAKINGEPCRNCSNKKYIEWSNEWVRRHLDGVDILGIYPLFNGDKCQFVAGNFDNHNGDRNSLADIKAFYEVYQAQEIPIYVLRSKSGKARR